tara:strand:- start:103 stop:342 length:240 start_codon:yes stop_codon:yes gene_type:complete
VKFWRSLYFVKNLKAGGLITADAVRSVRPGFGVVSKHLDAVLGKQVRNDVVVNSPVLHFTFESAEYSGTKQVFLACAMP